MAESKVGKIEPALEQHSRMTISAVGDIIMNSKVMNFIVFPDLFDNFMDNRQLFEDIVAHNKNV